VTALLALGLASAGRAQSATETAPATSVFTDPAKTAGSPDAPVPPDPVKPRRERVMSDEVAATLAVGMPKYNPPKPVVKKPEDEPAETKPEDKPKNGIVRLQKYVVREKRPEIFRDSDIATANGKAALAMKQNAGLHVGNFYGLNNPIALQMYQEQERLDNMAALADDAKSAKRSGDSTASDYIMKQSQQTFLRDNDFGVVNELGPK
jgi:hypothetical protein